jgi:hypothetical protein
VDLNVAGNQLSGELNLDFPNALFLNFSFNNFDSYRQVNLRPAGVILDLLGMQFKCPLPEQAKSSIVLTDPCRVSELWMAVFFVPLAVAALSLLSW